MSRIDQSLPLSDPTPGASATAGNLGKFLTHPLIILAILYFVGNGLRFLSIRNTEWDQVYMLAGRQLRMGDVGLYHATKRMQHVFSYPPFMALLATPFSMLPHLAGRAAWLAVNLVSVTLMWRWSWVLSGGPPLIGKRFDRREYLILLLGLLCAMRFVQDGLDHQQTDLVIGALLLGGCMAIAQSKDMLGATIIGIAAAMKCTPLLFVALLIWRKKWLASAWLIIVAIALNLLPNLISTPTGGGLWGSLWFHALIRPMGDANYRPGDWYSSVIFNQSISGAAYRFFVTKWSIADKALQVADRPNGMNPQSLKLITYAAEATLMLLAFAAFTRTKRNKKSILHPPSSILELPPTIAIQSSIILLLMLLLSPMSSKPHFCTMLLPGFCLARIAITGRDHVQLLMVIAAIVVGNVVIPNFFGSAIGDVGLWFGIVTGSAVLLLLGCYRSLWKGETSSSFIVHRSPFRAFMTDLITAQTPLATQRSKRADILLGLILLIFAGLFGQVMFRTLKAHDTTGHFGDFRHFYYAARAFLDHTDLYTSGDRGYLYPPLIAMLYSPIARLDYVVAGRIILFFNTAMACAGVLLVAPEYCKRFDAPTRREFVYAVALLGTLLNFDKIHMDLQMFQTNALMFLMFALSLRWLDRHPILAGFPLGVIFNIKYLSLAMLPWLIIRRRWGTAVGFIIAAVGFALLPAVVSGWNENLRDLQVAFGGLLHMVGIGHAVGSVTEQANVEDITAWFSCSLSSAMARMTLFGVPMRVALICAGMIALITLGVVILLYRRESIPLFSWPKRKTQIDQPWRAVISLEFSALVAASLCFSPQTNTKHLLLALLVTIPAAVLILNRRPGVPRYVVVVGMVIQFFGFILPVNDEHGTQALWIGTGGPAWCLLIGLLTVLSVGLLTAKKLAEKAPQSETV
jgi:Glycosyltransferase family 87